MSIRLFTLPGLRCEVDGGELVSLPGQKLRAALLVYLAVERETTRERLLGLLWPERQPERARRALSQMLYELGSIELKRPFFESRGDLLRALPDLEADAFDFTEAAARGDAAAALELYGGPFLDAVHLVDCNEFEEWVFHLRTKLERLHRRMRKEHIEQQRTAGDLEGALASAQRWAELEPDEEGAHQRVLELLVQTGQITEAERHYESYVQQLRREDLMPLDETRELMQRIRTARSTSHGTAAVAPAAPRPAAHSASPSGVPVVSPPGPAERADAAAEPIERELSALAPDLIVHRSIGVGGMARVYLAREEALSRPVAIKVLAPALASDEVAKRRFEREAQAAARIVHPGVVTVHGIGRTPGGLPYLVMPYYDAGTLEDRLASEGALPLQDALSIFSQLASALAAAHRLGIVHRDVRPANVLLDRVSGGVVLADFGLAAVLETASPAALRLTRPGEVLGTAAYASPEQLRGEDVTERADVYSLGVIAFQLLSGRLPYDATKAADQLMATIQAEPRRVREFRPDAPPAVEALIDRCLKKRPEHRPFAADVARQLEGR